jgi:hypothetical protein
LYICIHMDFYGTIVDVVLIFLQRGFILISVYSGSKMCPKDNTVISMEQIFPDTFCNREIMELQILCSNEHRGCNWTGPLKFSKVCVNSIYQKVFIIDCSFSSLWCACTRSPCGMHHLLSMHYTRKNLTSCNKSTNKPSTRSMYSHCLSQVVDRFGTTCNDLVEIIRLVARLFWQVRYMLDITRLLQPCDDNLVTSLLYHGCNKLVSTVL